MQFPERDLRVHDAELRDRRQCHDNADSVWMARLGVNVKFGELIRLPEALISFADRLGRPVPRRDRPGRVSCVPARGPPEVMRHRYYEHIIQFFNH